MPILNFFGATKEPPFGSRFRHPWRFSSLISPSQICLLSHPSSSTTPLAIPLNKSIHSLKRSPIRFFPQPLFSLISSSSAPEQFLLSSQVGFLTSVPLMHSPNMKLDHHPHSHTHILMPSPPSSHFRLQETSEKIYPVSFAMESRSEARRMLFDSWLWRRVAFHQHRIVKR